MYDTLFLEDCDLLENVFITNEINESNINYFGELISEQEMIISLYENQLFLVEQDTQVFMKLRYTSDESINEGALETIGNAILSVLRKIKELIQKFINFITGNRSKEKGNDKTVKELDKNIETLSKEIDKDIKKAKDENAELKETIYYAEKKVDDTRKDLIVKCNDKINKNTIRLSELEDDKSYIPIYINKDVMRNINITDKWTELEEVLNVFDEIISLVKQRKDITQKYEKIKDFNPAKGNISVSKEKGIYADRQNLCDRKTYFDKYYDNAKEFFRNYTDESSKNISYVQNLQNSRIIPLEKEVNSILKTLNKLDSYKKTVKQLHSIIGDISIMVNLRIGSMIAIENTYLAYKKNLITTESQLNEINAIKKNTENLKSHITRIEKILKIK